MINKIIIFLAFLCHGVYAQNPMEHWGVWHNTYLKALSTTENISSFDLKPLQNLGNQFFTSKSWELLDNDWNIEQMSPSVCKSLHLSPLSSQAVVDILYSEPNLSDELFLKKIQEWESILLKDTPNNTIGLGFLAVTKHSHQFWTNEKDQTAWKDDGKNKKRKVPFRVIVKYDAFGFLTGLVFGGVIYGGYEFFISKNRYDRTGLFVGIGVAVVATVWNSFRWARKYKERTTESDT